MGIFKCEHIKKLVNFTQIGILVKTNWVGYFWGFAGETLM